MDGRDTDRPLRTVGLGDVGSAHRWRFVAPGFDALQEVPKVGLEVRLIFLRRYAVDARRPILAGPHIGFSHPFKIDDVVQREQHRSRLPPRQFDYPMPFRLQVCRVHVPYRVSWQWFSPRGASLPSFGSQRAWFPALTGTMKALRLPTCVSAVAYLVRFRRPRDPPVFVFAVALLKGGRPPSGLGSLGTGSPWFRLFHVDAKGSLRSPGDPSRAFAPLLDPGRTDVPLPWRSHQCCPRF